MATKAFSYIRFSSKRQGSENKDSLRRQVELRDKWLAAHPQVELDDTLTLHDLGVSAFRGKNSTEGNLSAFLKAVEEKRIPKQSYFILENLDRLSRAEILSGLSVLLQLLNASIIVVTLQDGMEYRKEGLNVQDLLISIMTLQRGHEESATKSIRVKARWNQEREKIKSGVAGSFRCPAWLEKHNGKFKVIPERSKLIKEIYRRFISGQGGMKIAAELNRQGVPAWSRSGKWDATTIRYILKTRTVLGEYEQNLVEGGKKIFQQTIQSYYPAIITEEQYNASQKRIEDSTTTRGWKNTEDVPNLFTTVAKCGICGEKMMFHTNFRNTKAGRIKHRYLRCYGYTNGTCKPNTSEYQELEKTILAFLYELNLQDVLTNGEMVSEVELELSNTKKAIEKMEGRNNNLLDSLEEATGDTRKPIQERLNQNQRQLSELNLRASELQIKLSGLGSNQRQSFESCQEAIKDLQSGTSEMVDCRKRVHQLIHRIIRTIKIYSEERIIVIEFYTGKTKTIHYNKGVSAMMEDYTPSKAAAILKRQPEFEFQKIAKKHKKTKPYTALERVELAEGRSMTLKEAVEQGLISQEEFKNLEKNLKKAR